MLRRSVIFRKIDGSVGKSKPELVEWMKDMLKGKGWVKNTAPWLWPVLRASLEKGELNAFLDEQQDSFWWKYDYEKKLYWIRC